VIKVALTGGIGSGKSEVERLLAEHGAAVVDADQLAREVVEPGTPGLAAVIAEFGEPVLTADGGLDRSALAALVFADDGARHRLEAIVHPLVGSRAADLLDQAERDGREVIVYSVPLLVENGLGAGFDLVVVVDASDEVRLDRLVRLRGMSDADAGARMAAQAGRRERLAAADAVISNDGSRADLAAQVDALWAELRARARRTRPTS
jgi:dephospho-CoA kinase